VLGYGFVFIFMSLVWNFTPGYKILHLGVKVYTWVWNFTPGHETLNFLQKFNIFRSMKLHAWVRNFHQPVPNFSYPGAKLVERDRPPVFSSCRTCLACQSGSPATAEIRLLFNSQRKHSNEGRSNFIKPQKSCFLRSELLLLSYVHMYIHTCSSSHM
jgi:hypothetical protein